MTYLSCKWHNSYLSRHWEKCHCILPYSHPLSPISFWQYLWVSWVNRRPIQLKLPILSNFYYYKIPGDWVQICRNHKRWTTSLLHHSLYVSPALPFSVFHEPSPHPHSQKPVRFWEALISRMYKLIWSTHSIVEEVHYIYTLSLSYSPSFHFFYIALIINRLRVRHYEELVLL